MPKPKLLFVITGFTQGGAEKQMLNLLQGLQDSYDIQVIGFVDGYYKNKLEEIGIPVSLFPVQSSFGIFVAVWQVYKYIKRFNPELIQSFLPHANIVCKLANALHAGKYRLVTGVRNSQDPKLLAVLERLTNPFCSAIVTNSFTNKKALIKRGFPEHKIQVVYNGMHFPKPKEQYKYSQKTVLTVAKFYSQKDYDTNLAVAKELSQKRDDVQFLYVGDGPQREYMQNKAKQMGLLNVVHFLWSRNDVPELMHSSHVFFLPTQYEGQANAILEAMYYGLPIVTTNIPENTEICDAWYGSVGDVTGFAQHLNMLLDKQVDIIPIIQNNEQMARQFTASKMVEDYKRIYAK